MSSFAIAKIVKPQGIKGEVKAMPLTNVLAVFDNLKSVSIEGKVYGIKRISFRQGFLYITLNGVITRNQAEELRNKQLYVDKSQLEDAKGDYEFLLDDLIGMVLYDTNGDMVGQIMDVENYGATDNFIIEFDGRSYQVPFLKQVFLIQEDGSLLVDREKYEEVKV